MTQVTNKMGLSALILLMGIASVSANAESFLNEEFDYPDGVLDGVNGWTGNAGVTVTGGVAFHPGLDGDITLTIPAQTGGVVYVATRTQQGTDDPTFDSYGGLGLYNSGSEQLLIGKLWGVTDEWSLTGPDTSSGVDASQGVFQNIVTKIDIDNNEITMWILNDDATILGTPVATIDRAFAFNEVRLRGGNNGETNFQFDWVRVGTSLVDILPDIFGGGILGDTNGDGMVLIDDYEALRDNFETGTELSQGDVDFDGDVDQDDFWIIRDEFPKHNGGASLASAIPEPASIALIGLSSLAMLRRKNQH